MSFKALAGSVLSRPSLYSPPLQSVIITTTDLTQVHAMTAGQQTQAGPLLRGIGPREPSPFNIPNLLTALRFGMAIVMFVLIGLSEWGWTGVVFALASVTDW